MISSCFELILSVQQDDVLQQVKKSGDIQRVTATQEGWEFGVVFPDFETASEFFRYLLEQIVDFDVRWMVKDQNPFNESDKYPKTDLMA